MAVQVKHPAVGTSRRALPAVRRLALSAAARDVAVAWLLSRAVVWAAGLAAPAALAALGPAEGWRAFDPEGLTAPFGPTGDALVAPAARWDSMWLLAVAQDGYAGDEARTAFFGLYPALAALAGAPFGSALLGGVAVSWTAGLAGLWCVHRLAALELGDRYARPAVLAVACCPPAFFLSGVYTESLFLALSAGALLAARRDLWWAAGLLAAGAAATRSAGVALVVPLALLAWRERAGARGLWVLAPLAGCAAAVAAGASLGAQEIWFREWGGPLGAVPDGLAAAWDGVRQLLSGSRTPVYFEQAGGDPFDVARRTITDAAFLLAAVAALAVALRRLPVAYGAWAAAALAIPLSYPVGPQPLMSVPRFALVLFPLQVAAAAWLVDRRLGRASLAASLLGLAAGSALFTTWRFVA
jgi:hypothetical protein